MISTWRPMNVAEEMAIVFGPGQRWPGPQSDIGGLVFAFARNQ